MVFRYVSVLVDFFKFAFLSPSALVLDRTVEFFMRERKEGERMRLVINKFLKIVMRDFIIITIIMS